MRPAAPRSSTLRSMRGAPAPSLMLDELDLVAVGILDEGDDGRAEFHRARRPRDLDAFLGERRAGGIGIGNADRQMAEGRADRVRLFLVPVVGELDHGIAGLLAVADEGEAIAALRHLLLAQELHAEQPRVEIE